MDWLFEKIVEKKQEHHINLISPTGPDNAGLTIVFYLYNKGFNTTTGMGVAAATSWILCILIGIITFVNFRISDKWVNYD